jgi:outer membrane protein
MRRLLLNTLLFFGATHLFGDVLTFSRAYEFALQNDHALKSASYQTESGKERVNQAQAQLYPQVNFSAYYSKAEYKYNPEYGGKMVRQGLYSYGVSLQQTVYNPALFASIKAQKIQYSIYSTRLSLQKIELAQEVFQAYLELLKSYNKIELLESYSKLQESKLREASKRYHLNLVSKVDMLQTKVDFESTSIDLQREKKHFEVAEVKLKSLIGDVKYELPMIRITKSVLQSIKKMKEFIDAKSENLKNNLEVKQAQLSEDLADKKLSEANAGHLPKVNLNANFVRYGTDTPTVDTSYEYTDKVMLTIDIPIFSGFETSSKIVEAELLKKSAREDFYSAKQKAVVDRDEALSRFNVALESLPMYQKAFASAELYVNAMDESFKHGLKSIVDVNDANSKLYEVKYKYIDNLNELVDSYINLLIVLNNFEGMKYLDDILKEGN